MAAVPGPAGRAHPLAGVQGEEQGREAGGGVPPAALRPAVVDVLEERGAQDQHLAGSRAAISCSPSCRGDSRPCHPLPSPCCPPRRSARRRRWSLPGPYLASVSVDERLHPDVGAAGAGGQR